MNQKIEIFSLSLYLHQTLKRTILNEIWVNIFFPSLYRRIKDQNPNISKDLTKTFLKLPRVGLETTWRQCWSLGLKNVLSNRLRIPYCRLKAGFSVCWLRLFVSFCVSSDWDWMKYTRCERFLLVKPFYLFLFLLLLLLFSHLKITLDSEQPMSE